MKRLIILIAALMLITTGCHKDKVEPNHIIVTYYGNGGLTENGESSVKDVELVGWRKNVNLRANTFTRNGYNFKCWNTKADGKGTSYRDGDLKALYYDVDVDLYAQWVSIW